MYPTYVRSDILNTATPVDHRLQPTGHFGSVSEPVYFSFLFFLQRIKILPIDQRIVILPFRIRMDAYFENKMSEA